MNSIKRISLLFSFLMISIITLSQVGIGKFKIGTSLDSYKELTDAKKVIKSSDYGFNVKNQVSGYRWGETPVEMIADTNEVKTSSGMLIFEGSFSYLLTSSYGGSYFPNTRNFYIGSLKVNEDLTLHAVMLYFYDNKLAKIEVNENDLTEILTMKYGTPKEDVTLKKVLFSTKFGTTIEKEESSTTYQWIIDTQKIYTRKYNEYSDNGENSYHKYTCLIDSQYETIELLMVGYRSERYKQLKDKEQKKLLKDF